MTLYRQTFTGTLPAGDQFTFSWWSSNSLSLGSTNANAVTWLNNLMNGTGGAPGIKGHMNTGVVFAEVKTASVDPVTHKNINQAITANADAGTVATASCPQDIAIVCSLRTLNASRSGRGRFYLPAPAATTLATDGTLLTATRDDYVNSLLQAFTVAVGAGESPIVFSRKTGGEVIISQFGVGTVLDVQRRRVNKVSTVRNMVAMP